MTLAARERLLHNQHGHQKGRSCLADLVSSCAMATAPCLKERHWMQFSWFLVRISHSIPLAKLYSCGMSRFMMHRVKNWLKDRCQRIEEIWDMSTWRTLEAVVEGTTCEKCLRTLVMSTLVKPRLRGHIMDLCSSLRGHGEGHGTLFSWTQCQEPWEWLKLSWEVQTGY